MEPASAGPDGIESLPSEPSGTGGRTLYRRGRRAGERCFRAPKYESIICLPVPPGSMFVLPNGSVAPGYVSCGISPHADGAGYGIVRRFGRGAPAGPAQLNIMDRERCVLQAPLRVSIAERSPFPTGLSVVRGTIAPVFTPASRPVSPLPISLPAMFTGRRVQPPVGWRSWQQRRPCSPGAPAAAWPGDHRGQINHS